jgi:hypothetical protein
LRQAGADVFEGGVGLEVILEPGQGEFHILVLTLRDRHNGSNFFNR